MFSIATAPAKQSVGDTIAVLSGRLSSATLLEDRRAAILGLRSFSKEYPASVASGALRSLIGSLSKDGEDVDTVKVILETLLMLVSPNEDSVETGDEIALWLADEFTQRQENITVLLDFLETNDFYSRLYSLQLLSAILSARTERTEESVFTAPLGIPRLVALLDERREAIRNEAITLLTNLTPTNPDIQKLVAFENAFGRVFQIVSSEGGLAEGGRVVEDCLILLANLLRLNFSNQSLFREEGYIPRLSKLLETTYSDGNGSEEIAPWAEVQRNRNVFALLAVVRLFLYPGAVGTSQNQSAFGTYSVLFHSLQLAFSSSTEDRIKSEALVTCADIIKGNPSLQEGFAQLQVPSPLGSDGLSNGHGPQAKGAAKVYVIDGLLDLTLGVHSSQAFDTRMAACQVLEAYFYNHPEVRLHFLKRAIEGHQSGVDETANILTVLLRPLPDTASSEPYRYWFAAVIMLHLIYENPTAKAMAMAVTEGDESNGEEVVTSIQTVTAHLLSSLAKNSDTRILLGYLMLLACWLFEDLDAVNDFLGEGSNVQGLAKAVVEGRGLDPMVQGLCAMLLGIVYDFSTKDSPLPRATLQPLLLSLVGRDRFMDRLAKLRSNPFMRDYEVLPQRMDTSSDQKHPDVYFDGQFVDFFKDNYSRVLKAIDREPGMEISVVTNGVQKGISREMVDGLRAQLDEKERAMQGIQVEIASLTRQVEQEQADHRRTKESAVAEAARVRNVNEGLQRHHDEEIRGIHAEHAKREDEAKRQMDKLRAEYVKKEDEIKGQMDKLRAEHRSKEEELRRQMEYMRKAGEAEAERTKRRAEADIADLRATISRLEVDVMKANKSKTQELGLLREEHAAKLTEQATTLKRAEERSRELEIKIKQAEQKSADLELRLKVSADDIATTHAQLRDKEDEKEATQAELDDLLIVFNDLEEKKAKYKGRLKALGEEVSEAEDEDEEADGEEGEDGEDEVD